ncbi:hypothetical protein [Campylobacter hominis]
MTKEQIQLELTKLIIEIKKPEIIGRTDDTIKPIVDIYKKVGELLDSPTFQDQDKQVKD